MPSTSSAEVARRSCNSAGTSRSIEVISVRIGRTSNLPCHRQPRSARVNCWVICVSTSPRTGCTSMVSERSVVRDSGKK